MGQIRICRGFMQIEIMIKELGEIITGNTPSKKKQEFWKSKDIFFVKPDSIPDNGVNIIRDSNEYISEEAREKARIASQNSIFVTCIGSIGKIGIAAEGEFAFNQQINVVVPNKNINAKYLAYNLLFNKSRLMKIANAPVVPIINKSQFGEFTVKIESDIKKQTEIVYVLDKISNIVKHRMNELEMLDNLIKARFVEMFGDAVDNPMRWNKKQLQEIVTDDCTISYGIVQTGEDQKDGVPVFRPVDIVNRIPKLEELKKTTEKISNKYKKTILKGREMLITVRANIAETCIVGEEFKGCNVGRGIVPIRTKEDIMVLEFLKYILDSKHINDDIKRKAKGITLIQLNMQDLREIELIIPPMEKQKAYVQFAKQVDKSKVAVQKALDEAQLLFDSLMQEYFG